MSEPSPFLLEWLPRIAAELPGGAAALDVAMGGGRHAQLLASLGFAVFGVDRDEQRVREAVAMVRSVGRPIRAWVSDLTVQPLPKSRFELVVCTNYLDRAWWPCLRATVKRGGLVLYETFTLAQLRLPWGPRSPEHLLRPGELRDAFSDWSIRFYEEVDRPAAQARLIARKRIA